MSRKELLPALDLVLETYVTGLDRDYDIAQSLADQFSVGEPSYSAGLVFEVPLHRRAARARLQRRQLERRQITQQFEEVVLTLRAEVEVAIREVSATYRELVARRPLLEVVANPCSCRRSRQLRPRAITDPSSSVCGRLVA